MQKKILDVCKTKVLSKQNGITLIALIVTIVVILILAGVTISKVFDEDGIITQAEAAKISQQEADDMQEIKIAVSAEDLDVAMDRNKTTRDALNISTELKKKYDEVNTESLGNNEFKVIIDGRSYKVDKYGEVTKWGTTPVETPTFTVDPTPIPTVLPTETPVPTATPIPTPTYVNVESVTISGRNVLDIGEEIKLSVTVLPSNATNPEVTWWSSDEKLAIVDDNGVVNSVQGYGGNVTIYAEADGVIDEYEIHVHAYYKCVHECGYGCYVTCSLCGGTGTRPIYCDGILEEFCYYPEDPDMHDHGVECNKCNKILRDGEYVPGQICGDKLGSETCPNCNGDCEFYDCHYGGNGTLICGY